MKFLGRRKLGSGLEPGLKKEDYRRDFRRIRGFAVRAFTESCLVIVAILSLSGSFGKSYWLLDLSTHFKFQYLSLSLLLTFVFTWQRRFFLTILSLILVAANFMEVGFLAGGFRTSKPLLVSEEKLRILVLNVLTVNKRYGDILDYVQEKHPDVLALLEVNKRWIDALEPVLKPFPFRVYRPDQNNFGLALFSRLPLINPHVRLYTWNRTPGIEARVKLGKKEIVMHLTHPVPPLDGLYWTLRNNHLRELADRTKTLPFEHLVFGDLNLSPWSPFFKDFLSETGLKDSVTGLDHQGTWPTGLPFLYAPIDHFLMSSGLDTLHFEVGPDIGSDHLPVFLELGLNYDL
jgi:endonuclease/exonuclease/phosphatase (EEP) superfamily protein YafD